MSNDAKIENLLRDAMTQEHRNSSHAPGSCPDDELLAAYLDGGLDEAQRETVEAHLDTCDDCRLMLGLAFQSQEEHSAGYSQDMVDQASALARPAKAAGRTPARTNSIWDALRAFLTPPRLALGAAAVIAAVVVIGVFDPSQPDYMAKTEEQAPAQVAMETKAEPDYEVAAPADQAVSPMKAQQPAEQALIPQGKTPGPAPGQPSSIKSKAPVIASRAPAPGAVKRERTKGAPPQSTARNVFRYEPQTIVAANRLNDVCMEASGSSRSALGQDEIRCPGVASLGYFKLRTSQVTGFNFDYTTPDQLADELSKKKYPLAIADTVLLGKLPQGYKAIPVARYPLAVIVNQANPVQSLTTGQLRGIYSGQTANWLELGGPNQPIEALDLPANTYAAGIWSTLIGQDHDAASVVARLEMIHYLSQTPAAIGYAPVGQIMGMQNAKALAVDGVSPLAVSGGFNKDYKFGGQIAVVYQEASKADAETLAMQLKGRR